VVLAAAPGPASPGKLRISAGVMETNLIHKIDPEYPNMAKIAHIQGDVVLRCIIDKQGNIAEMRVISGHPILAQPALDAVKQWKYKPYVLNGEPVEVETPITVRFHM
jgi:protein TonB